MAATTKDKKRTYVTLQDPRTKRKARCFTVYGLSPRALEQLILAEVRGSGPRVRRGAGSVGVDAAA